MFKFSSVVRVAIVLGLMGAIRVEIGARPAFAASKLVCKTGFKAGKTPVSLKTGGKVGCVNTKAASLGKKLLTGTANVCYACHSSGGIQPAQLMSSNLRAQGYTLSPANIMNAFNAHSSEMLGATLTSKDAKNISQYLQTLKIQ